MAEFQLKVGNWEKSISQLETINQYITATAGVRLDETNLKFVSRYNHLTGMCLKAWGNVCFYYFPLLIYFFTSEKKYDVALIELYKSLTVKRHLSLRHEEGVVLLDIAKTHIERGQSEFSLAESCLHQCKEIFVALNDVINAKKASFIMADLKMRSIQPLFLDLIKNSPFNYCDKYRLICWKSTCQPFWHNLHRDVLNEKKNALNCLLKVDWNLIEMIFH